MGSISQRFLRTACLGAASLCAVSAFAEDAETAISEEYQTLFKEAAGDYDFPFSQECYAVRGEKNLNLAIHRVAYGWGRGVSDRTELLIISDAEYENGFRVKSGDAAPVMKCIKAEGFTATFRPVAEGVKARVADLLREIIVKDGELPNEVSPNAQRVVLRNDRYAGVSSQLEAFLNGDPKAYTIEELQTVLNGLPDPDDDAPYRETLNDLRIRIDHLMIRTTGFVSSQHGSYLDVIPEKIEQAEKIMYFRPARKDLF